MKKFFLYPLNWFSKLLQRHEMKKKGYLQSSKNKRLTQEGSFTQAAEKSKTIGILILFVVWCASVGVLVMPSLSDKPDQILVEDQIAPNIVYADFDFSYINDCETELKKQHSLRKVPLVYKIDYDISRKSIDHATLLFNTLSEKKSEQVAIKALSTLSENETNTIISFVKNDISKQKLINAIRTALFYGIISKTERFRRTNLNIRIDKDNVKEKSKKFSEVPTPDEVTVQISEQVAKTFTPDNRLFLKNAISKLLMPIIVDDLIFDQELTDIDKQKISDATPQVKTFIKKDDVIIEKGKVITKKDLIRYNYYLKEQGKVDGNKDFYRNFFVSAFLCLLLMCLSGLYIGHIHPEIIESNHKMALIGTVIIIGIFVNYFAFELFYRMRIVFDLHPQLVTCIIPISLGSIILSPMVGLRVAHYAGIYISIMAAMLMDNSFAILINGMLICGLSGFIVRHRPNHRSYFLSAALVVALSTPILSLIDLWNIEGNSDLISQVLFLGIGNGVITAIAALGLLFILEIIFKISSDMTLLLLCDYNHPLLKRLQLEAPGTYHHSLIVSTLAEHAAEAIGANPIRARVISLFHDIGKINKPEYFIENDPDADNKHKRIKPNMSSLIITGHVKDGTTMAIKHKLRRIIKDGIQQHHGTDIISCFYHNAMEAARDNNTTVNENEFRYDGPLPKEKEVVILSLADACEAASKSLEKPTQQKIDALIWEIFRKRIRTGQLNDANLTFAELNKIRVSFVSTLTTMLHSRITYPKDQEDDNEGDLFMATAHKENSPKK